MKLVGSPVSFIRGPFVAEGLLQGGFGALIAVGLLWAGFAVVRAWWGGDLSAILEGAAIQFLPVRLVGLLVAGAMERRQVELGLVDILDTVRREEGRRGAPRSTVRPKKEERGGRKWTQRLGRRERAAARKKL